MKKPEVPRASKGVRGNSTGRWSSTKPVSSNLEQHIMSALQPTVQTKNSRPPSQMTDQVSSPYDIIHGLQNTTIAPAASTTPVPRNPVTQPVASSPSRKRRSDVAPSPVSPSKKLLENGYIQDRLGTLVSALSEKLQASNSWKDFVQDVHGPSYLSGAIDDIDHPAKSLLQSYRDQGVPVVVSDDPW